jgi:hypothetical protein
MSGKASVFYLIFKAIAAVAGNVVTGALDRPPVSPRHTARPYYPNRVGHLHEPE